MRYGVSVIIPYSPRTKVKGLWFNCLHLHSNYAVLGTCLNNQCQALNPQQLKTNLKA